ncbi:MAG TPA: hypothetical protein VEH47_06355 [Candidatus Acidoferrales bacterium]|nr:hypothetical protein [Candidatus Acidoferrales bacterium]
MENRKRATGQCPDCKDTPKVADDGRLRCRCADKVWAGRQGVRGSEEEYTFMTNAGFEMTGDVQGDVYYVGPFGHIVWLYPDGEWFADKAPVEYLSLEEYVTG